MIPRPIDGNNPIITKDHIRSMVRTSTPPEFWETCPWSEDEWIEGLWLWYRSKVWEPYGISTFASPPRMLLGSIKPPQQMTRDRFESVLCEHIKTSRQPLMVHGKGADKVMLAYLFQSCFATQLQPHALDLPTLTSDDPFFGIGPRNPVAIELAPEMHGRVWVEKMAPIIRFIKERRGPFLYWTQRKDAHDELSKALLEAHPPETRYRI